MPDEAERAPEPAEPIQACGENRLGSLFALLELLGVTTFMALLTTRASAAVIVPFLCSYLLLPIAGISARVRRTWRSPSIARLSAGVMLGFFATWLAMHLSTVSYVDCSVAHQEEWQWRFGMHPWGDTVSVPPVVAGFPFWGVGGGGPDGWDIDVVRSDFVGPLKPEEPSVMGVSSYSYGGPPLRVDRGALLLWLDWWLMTMASWFLCLAIPARFLGRMHGSILCLGLFGLVLASGWLATHGYE